MRPVVVVVLAPVVDDSAHVAKAGEPVLRQALVAEASVETLDTGVLHRLVRLDEADLDVIPDRSGMHGASCELRAVVGADNLEDPTPGPNTNQIHKSLVGRRLKCAAGYSQDCDVSRYSASLSSR